MGVHRRECTGRVVVLFSVHWGGEYQPGPHFPWSWAEAAHTHHQRCSPRTPPMCTGSPPCQHQLCTPACAQYMCTPEYVHSICTPLYYVHRLSSWLSIVVTVSVKYTYLLTLIAYYIPDLLKTAHTFLFIPVITRDCFIQPLDTPRCILRTKRLKNYTGTYNLLKVPVLVLDESVWRILWFISNYKYRQWVIYI